MSNKFDELFFELYSCNGNQGVPSNGFYNSKLRVSGPKRVSVVADDENTLVGYMLQFACDELKLNSQSKGPELRVDIYQKTDLRLSMWATIITCQGSYVCHAEAAKVMRSGMAKEG